MKLNYITKPRDQYVTHLKTESMKRTRTLYQCPLCQCNIPKRSFEDHVYTKHKLRADEAFAMFYGVKWPAKCSCGRDLHYNRTHRGFQVSCGYCTQPDNNTTTYKSANDAHSHVEQLEQMLLAAKEQEKKLRQEEKLETVPLEELPFPSVKYKTFMARLAMARRVNAVNGDKDKLFGLANFIQSRL